MVLPVVLYGCETWSVTLREEIRFRGFKNSVLREIIGPKREAVLYAYKNENNEELHALYSSPNIRLLILRRGDGQGM